MSLSQSPTLTVRIDRNYGRITVYPACPISQIFAELAGHKTLTPKTLRLIQSLGYTINPQASAEAILKEYLC